MKKIQISIDINAPKEKVWEKLWSDEGYRRWTSAFTEGSYAESDWEQGSSIKFLSPSGDGMFATIEEIVPFKKMIFRHQGEIRKGVEQPMDWAGATESYYLNEEGGKTTVRVEADSTEEFAGYLEKTFPKALEILKQISEE